MRQKMGGCCCCCSSRRSEPIRTQNYYYYPRASEERLPLSAAHHRGGPSSVSPGLLVDTNLDASEPDTYTPPPAPIPYNVDSGHHPPKSGPISDTANAASVAISLQNPKKDLKGINDEPPASLELNPSKEFEDDLKKSVETIVTTIEEEDCPICLEEYTEENPKMMTECNHHFHLCCILEWMERSDKCPVCDKEVNIDETFDG